MKKTYNFQKQERKWQKFWEKEKIFKFNPKKKGRIFSIDTPPPTVSGKMHLGHAFSYTHQDVIARYHRMKGENVFYPFGTDDNGLPTEKLVERENQVKLFELGRESFVKLCRLTIKRILPDFIADWKGIGMSCDFSQIYSTISPEVQKLSQKYFIELFNRRRIYRKSSPTFWCPECQTAIAQAELENRETDSFFVDIEFEIEGGQKIIIATTRPELLASCVAIFAHPQDNRFKHLIGQAAIVPLFGQKIKILSDKRVEVDKGTGAVMCCTFGDVTDIDWYFEHKLPLRLSVKRDGKMHQLAGEFAGLSVKEARIRIIEKLKEKGLIKNIRKIVHPVNVHERCGREIEILPATQWFIRYLDLKNQFLSQSQKLNWYPLYMKTRLDHWIEGLRWDWCISRQRYFGIPIPVWYCKNCGEIVLPKESDLPLDPLHSKPKKKCRCKSSEFIPESDVLDTWLTSSLSPQIALDLVKDKKMRDKMFPMSLRPQAHDIINFWLFYTLARSYLHFKNVPWQEVMISGFVLDPRGEKMSKSKGNVIEPQTIIEKYGADAMRFWAAQSNLGDDLRYCEEEIKIGKKTVTKIWNASRFCLMHIKNYKSKKLDAKNLADEDKWILTKLYRTTEEYIKRMEKYEYAGAKTALDNFFWKDFCDNYLEIIKLRIYENKNKQNFKTAQFALYTSLLAILKLYAPIVPHITEEIYQMHFKKYEKEKSIHLTKLPRLTLCFPAATKAFELAIEAITQIRKYKSEHQLSMKAEVEKLTIKTKNKTKIKKYLPLIGKLMSVKQIEAEHQKAKR